MKRFICQDIKERVEVPPRLDSPVDPAPRSDTTALISMPFLWEDTVPVDSGRDAPRMPCSNLLCSFGPHNPFEILDGESESSNNNPETPPTDTASEGAEVPGRVDQVPPVIKRHRVYGETHPIDPPVKRARANPVVPPSTEEIGLSYLTPEELEQGMRMFIRAAKLQGYPEEIRDLNAGRRVKKSSSLLQLTPFLDAQGLMRVGGILEYSRLPVGRALLPTHHPPTGMIFRKVHIDHLHSSVERTLHEIGKMYWIPRARQVIRHYIAPCHYCKRRDARPSQQKKRNIPAENLQHGDIVSIRDDNAVRDHWKFGRVVATHPGRDNIARVVTVRTADGKHREEPVSRVCLLEANASFVRSESSHPDKAGRAD